MRRAYDLVAAEFGPGVNLTLTVAVDCTAGADPAATPRAPRVAVKAAVMNLLSVAAAFGVVTALFQTDTGAHLLGLPHGGLVTSWVPILMFTVLFGLSMDYKVFLLSRVREDWVRATPAAAWSAG